MTGVHACERDSSGILRTGSASAFVALALASFAASAGPAHAGKIEWSGSGPYESCLEQEADAWLRRKAELVVANDEGARATNDGEVAGFTVDLMKSCAGKGAPTSAANETAFTKYMARWREHVYELAKVIRATGGSD